MHPQAVYWCTKPHSRVFIFDIYLTQIINELVVGMGGITW